MDTAEVLAQVKRLQIIANRQVDDLLAGAYLSVFKGRGMEFDEVREYAPGDDVRAIDWNVTARTGVPHVKRYAEERELTILFLVDISRSGVFGSGDRAKLELATQLAAVLMFSALKNNDKAGLLLFADDVEGYYPPRKGKGHVLRLIRELVALQPDQPLAEAVAGRTTSREDASAGVARALEFTRRVCRRKAVVFLLSDLPGTAYEDELRIVRRRHDVVAITVGDRRDLTLSDDAGGSLPGVRFVRLVDAETGRILIRDLHDRALRQAYAEAAEQERTQRTELLRRSGVDELAIDTGRSYVADLRQFFRMRERRINQGR